MIKKVNGNASNYKKKRMPICEKFCLLIIITCFCDI
jgi:hypothetical protein